MGLSQWRPPGRFRRKLAHHHEDNMVPAVTRDHLFNVGVEVYDHFSELVVVRESRAGSARLLVLPHPDIANPLQVREVGVWCGIFQRDLGWSETGARRARVALREAGVVRANKLARAWPVHVGG